MLGATIQLGLFVVISNKREEKKIGDWNDKQEKKERPK